MEVESLLETRQLLASLPGCAELRRFRARGERVIRLRCDRSLPFEYVDELLDPFLALWGATHFTEFSDYDPGLAQVTSRSDAQIRLLFLDWRLNQLAPADAAQWASERARAALRTSRVVLLNNWPGAEKLNAELGKLRMAGLHLVDLEALRAELPGNFFDARNDAVSKFPFSSRGAAAIARHLALDLLPTLAGERIKCLVLDLDDTLWGGVLAEEGVEHVAIDEGHRELHAHLAGLRRRGILLCLCSQNERADVESIFQKRTDLGLSLADFASIQVDWSPKAQKIARIAAEVNVHPSSLLFVDDNPAELAKARRDLPDLRVLLADPKGAETKKALHHFPGLFALTADSAAALRTEDIRANRERESRKAQAGDTLSYLASLRMEVDLYQNCRAHASRLHELSQKTNQFNLALARLGAQEAEEAFGPDHVTMTVALRDTLSDSGLVGAIVARAEGEVALVRELLFSCRVLGRDVETLALARFCRWLEERGVQRVQFAVTEGPRNDPARNFLARLAPEGTATLADLKAHADQGHPATVKEHR